MLQLCVTSLPLPSFFQKTITHDGDEQVIGSALPSKDLPLPVTSLTFRGEIGGHAFEETGTVQVCLAFSFLSMVLPRLSNLLVALPWLPSLAS